MTGYCQDIDSEYDVYILKQILSYKAKSLPNKIKAIKTGA